MTHQKFSCLPLDLRQIRRHQVQQHLAWAAAVALLLASCSTGPEDSAAVSEVTDQNANEQINAVFYKDTEQCEADIRQQQKEYQVLVNAHQQGELTQPPNPPIMKVEDCEAQMLAAQQEHDRNAPVYATQAECEAEGVQCEATPVQSSVSGYRPTYGGTYLYPYGGGSDFIYINTGGSRHRVYQPRTVYQSKTSGQVVTPYGRSVTQTQTGQVTVPRHTSVTAPQRPAGTAAKGTITGRGTQGFGSTYKSTGRGGK
ncbi:DUF1190 domain-containing protein [Lyngbya confervoides]|uniref:DUF1190 domain-containing protein n=1 Tax=Lyngbya confervoides BDU141951 TaxID=1574623 RepID=A0ABD4T0W8_9CYAN|nr:DUF1190 domain-containing protein [Lyngbya confervoides]MCM1982214.1 DUF1190 domain-containing protein [Lyngbya confervoides BDU141951]